MLLHQAHAAKEIDSISIRFHSDHRADVQFVCLDEANAAFDAISKVLPDHKVSKPYCPISKQIHIVGQVLTLKNLCIPLSPAQGRILQLIVL